MNDIFKSVTVQQFKEYYFRDFPFLPLYQEGTAYFTNEIVYFNNNFYKSLTDNNWAPPTDADNWQIVNIDKYSYITDEDIQKAIGQALLNANERFGADDDDKIVIFLHLVAFYLVIDLKNAAQGVNSSYGGLVASKSVGDVSEGYNFPQWVTSDPNLSIFMQNGYGMKYVSLILPYLSVTLLFAPGRSTIG